MIVKYFTFSRIFLLVILLIGLFVRLYKLEIFYPWGHDQDLFAWIAKDILIDHHLRLIGQETSIIGVFIGPLFYYLIAISFALFKMNPLAAASVTTAISLLTIVSIYWVFSKFFSKNVGIVGSFLYAISPGAVFLDRWVVPTQPTILWSVWFLYVIFSLLKGNLHLIPLGILIGLIWHIHIAFIPLLLLLPLAFLISDKKSFKLNYKTLIISALILLSLISPFFVFEVRHGFQQTNSLFQATYQDIGDLTGSSRAVKVISSGGRSLAGAFVVSNTVIGLPLVFTSTLSVLLLLGIIYLGYRQILTKNQTTILIVWYAIVFLGQFFSKRIITEYYFNNLFVILFLTLSIFLVKVHETLRKSSLIPILLIFYLIGVITWFLNRSDDLGGFLYKRQVIEYIKADSLNKNYPCVSINFIESQPGEGNGFRYLYWLSRLKIITASNDVAAYNIVNPWTISKDEISARFGNIGVIVPTKKVMDPKICIESDRQLLPLWGFNN